MEETLYSREHICVDNSDTLINGMNYSQVWECDIAYRGALRDDGLGRIYYVPKDETVERLVYDFSLNTGDTVTVYIEDPFNTPNYAMQNVQVSNVQYIDINGVQRKALDMSGSQWIEGIGCTQGLFREPWANVSNYGTGLECMSHVDTSLYGMIGSEICPRQLGFSGPDWSWLQVYPNPASEYIHVKGIDNEPAKFRLYTLSGVQIFERDVVKENYKILLGDLQPGMYIMEFSSENRLYREQLVKR